MLKGLPTRKAVLEKGPVNHHARQHFRSGCPSSVVPSFHQAFCNMLGPAYPTVWGSIAGICPRDAGLCPEADAHVVTCRQPKLCVGYNKEPWKVMEKADGTPGQQKMGMSGGILFLKSKSGLTSITKCGGTHYCLRLPQKLVFSGSCVGPGSL